MLALLHKKSLVKSEHEVFWERRAALSPESVAGSLFFEEILRVIRREIKRKEGVLLDIEDVASALHECLSDEAREIIGPLKIKRRRKAKVRQQSPSQRHEDSIPAVKDDDDIIL